jgi:hypothetical protein
VRYCQNGLYRGEQGGPDRSYTTLEHQPPQEEPSNLPDFRFRQRPATTESEAPSSAFGDQGEDSETFWARRASMIQHFYNLWDCNQLSNEAFTSQLQTILGQHVDVSTPESEVVRLTNQHRFARNLKFAELMAALRRDARKQRFGTVSPSYAGSIVGSMAEPTPSEAPSEPSYAAGRPTSLLSGGFVGVGRKHYAPSDTQSLMGDDDLQSTRSCIRREPQPRTPAPFADMSDIPAKSTQALQVPRSPAPYANESSAKPSSSIASSVPRSPAPFANGGTYADGYPQAARPPSQKAGPDPGFWMRTAPRTSDERSDVTSLYGDNISVAGSQREEFAARARGHGNILTWGNDSRSITPGKKRQGRQLAVDTDGMPKAHVTSGVFPS